MKLEVGAKSEAGSAHPYEDRMLLDEEAGLFCVADGVTHSSYGSGAVAAELALALLREAFTGDLAVALGRVNQLSLERRKGDTTIGETTLTAASVNQSTLEVANVGDSPALLVRGGRTESLSVEDRGPGGRITQVVGYRSLIEVHRTRLELEPGDMVVVASDGVGHVLTNPLLTGLAKTATAAKAADSIVKQAKSVPSGYDDDKTVIVLKVKGRAP